VFALESQEKTDFSRLYFPESKGEAHQAAEMAPTADQAIVQERMGMMCQA